ncbi:hypothetical protein GQ55_2G324900 [Panicum hallii var. hallii]|uniref:F-box domain-containing protein n=1 Tax=Panicum hallii var. hallii TaxID=1504633 RepID=A0A2T7EUS9_9POAL|nr:hypothetical protein GQ55_2G324900 [Panicum hallii var. hallii]
MAVEPFDGLLRVSTVLERDEAQARAALGPFPRDVGHAHEAPQGRIRRRVPPGAALLPAGASAEAPVHVVVGAQVIGVRPRSADAAAGSEGSSLLPARLVRGASGACWWTTAMTSPAGRRPVVVRSEAVAPRRRCKADGSPGPCSAAGRDRLSSLPDDLIERILSLLPTPQAVLTSQLSRRWRRAWAHVTALTCPSGTARGAAGGARFRALATGALLRFPTPGIPSVSVEINRSAYTADEWYLQAMERAVGSVRVASPRALNGLELPPCARAGALAVRSPRTVLTLPDPAADLPSFGRLAELSLSLVQLGGARPLGEFLASCCPRLRTLRLCSVRGPALRRLALRTDALEVLDVSNVDDLTLTSLDAAATNLPCLSVSSCFRSPTGGGGEVAVSAPRIEAVRWYRSYPEQLIFRSDLASARRLGGPLRLPARPVGRRSHPAAPARLLPRPPPRPGARDAGRDESSPLLARTSRAGRVRGLDPAAAA